MRVVRFSFAKQYADFTATTRATLQLTQLATSKRFRLLTRDNGLGTKVPRQYSGSDRPQGVPHFSIEDVQRLTSAQILLPCEAKENYILPDLPPVYKQLGIGSCTANAVASCLSYAWKKSTGLAYEQFQPSRLWIYYHARTSIDPDNLSEKVQNFSDLVKTDTGSHIRSAIHSVLTQGICVEELWPYGNPSSDKDTDLFLDIDRKPNPCEHSDWTAAKAQAAESNNEDPSYPSDDTTTIPRAVIYYRIFDPAAKASIDPATQLPASAWQAVYNQPSVVLLEQTLLDGFPFVFGVQFFRGHQLRKSELDQNAVFGKPPKERGKQTFRHTMLAVGYDSARRVFLVQNSWGDQWPTEGLDQMMSGRLWMPYEWFEAVVEGEPVTYDYWVIKIGKRKRLL